MRWLWFAWSESYSEDKQVNDKTQNKLGPKTMVAWCWSSLATFISCCFFLLESMCLLVLKHIQILVSLIFLPCFIASFRNFWAGSNRMTLYNWMKEGYLFILMTKCQEIAMPRFAQLLTDVIMHQRIDSLQFFWNLILLHQ